MKRLPLIAIVLVSTLGLVACDLGLYDTPDQDPAPVSSGDPFTVEGPTSTNLFVNDSGKTATATFSLNYHGNSVPTVEVTSTDSRANEEVKLLKTNASQSSQIMSFLTHVYSANEDHTGEYSITFKPKPNYDDISYSYKATFTVRQTGFSDKSFNVNLSYNNFEADENHFYVASEGASLQKRLSTGGWVSAAAAGSNELVPKNKGVNIHYTLNASGYMAASHYDEHHINGYSTKVLLKDNGSDGKPLLVRTLANTYSVDKNGHKTPVTISLLSTEDGVGYLAVLNKASGFSSLNKIKNMKGFGSQYISFNDISSERMVVGPSLYDEGTGDAGAFNVLMIVRVGSGSHYYKYRIMLPNDSGTTFGGGVTPSSGPDIVADHGQYEHVLEMSHNNEIHFNGAVKKSKENAMAVFWNSPFNVFRPTCGSGAGDYVTFFSSGTSGKVGSVKFPCSDGETMMKDFSNKYQAISCASDLINAGDAKQYSVPKTCYLSGAMAGYVYYAKLTLTPGASTDKVGAATLEEGDIKSVMLTAGLKAQSDGYPVTQVNADTGELLFVDTKGALYEANLNGSPTIKPVTGPSAGTPYAIYQD